MDATDGAMTYEDFLSECLEEPLKYVVHDTDARLSDELRRGTATGGFDFLGKFWTFVECIAAKRGHYYDVSDDVGWSFLRLDMCSGGGEMTVDECKEFVGRLYDLGLIERSEFDESKLVSSRRVMRTAESNAEVKAKRKMAAYNTNLKRARSRG